MGEKRCFVSEYSSLLLDNRKCKKWIMECVNEHSVFSKSDFGGN